MQLLGLLHLANHRHFPPQLPHHNFPGLVHHLLVLSLDLQCLPRDFLHPLSPQMLFLVDLLARLSVSLSLLDPDRHLGHSLLLQVVVRQRVLSLVYHLMAHLHGHWVLAQFLLHHPLRL